MDAPEPLSGPSANPSPGSRLSLSTVEALLEAVYALDIAAEGDAWDEALEIESLCHELLHALVVGPQDLLQAETLETVAMIYRRVMELAEDCRAAVAVELRQVQQGRRATRAYGAERGA